MNAGHFWLLYYEVLVLISTSVFVCFLWLHFRRRQWHPTPVLLPGTSHDGGAWWAAVHGVTKSWTWLSDFPFTFHFHALEKEMATHSSVLAWRIPGTGEPVGLPSMGLHRVGHNWSDLAAAAVWLHCREKLAFSLLPIESKVLIFLLASVNTRGGIVGQTGEFRLLPKVSLDPSLAGRNRNVPLLFPTCAKTIGVTSLLPWWLKPWLSTELPVTSPSGGKGSLVTAWWRWASRVSLCLCGQRVGGVTPFSGVFGCNRVHTVQKFSIFFSCPLSWTFG